MTLKELALNLPAIKDEAKHIWGEDRYSRRKVVISDHRAFSTIRTSGISKKPKTYEKMVRHTVHGWKRHIQNMIESDDPEQYLKDNMPKEKM